MVPCSNFYMLVCFSTGALTSTTEAKGYTSATAFSEALTTAREYPVHLLCFTGLQHRSYEAKGQKWHQLSECWVANL